MDDMEQFKEWLTSVTVLCTCPECGNVLKKSEVIPTYPPMDVYKCYNCGWSTIPTSQKRASKEKK